MKSPRTIELAKIHAGKRDLGLDDGTYRALLLQLTGKSSAADLGGWERRSVIEYMKRKGAFANIRKVSEKATPTRSPQLKKIDALLADMSLPANYADGIAKQMFQVERVEWCEPHQLTKVIAALEIHRRRH